jgi:hypothetical protein
MTISERQARIVFSMARETYRAPRRVAIDALGKVEVMAHEEQGALDALAAHFSEMFPQSAKDGYFPQYRERITR